MQMKLSEEMKSAGYPVTFSIGVITFITMPETVDAAFEMADRIMYSVKTSGKDGVSFAAAE
jgi:PleD family two-component response regulator